MTTTEAPTGAAADLRVQADPSGPLPRLRLVRAGQVLRTHPWAAAVAVLAIALRVAAIIAYRPVLEFHGDSYHYLDNARHLRVDLWHPIGYALVLRVLSWTGSLLTVSVVQHALGLATGWVIYRFVRERGVGDALAALAAAPILLDAWQVVAEHTVIAEALFEFLVALAVLLLTRPVVTRRAAVTGGALLAAATLTRTIGLFIAVIVVGYLVVRRVGWRTAVAGGAAAFLPLVGYAVAFKVANGVFGLQGYSGRYLYGEAATFAQCSRLHLSADERLLCPHLPVGMRPGSNSYVWADDSPVWLLHETDQVRLSRTAGRFASAVIRHQPVSYAKYVAVNTLHYFDVGRVEGPRDYTAATWQFPSSADPPPVWHINVATMGFGGGYVHPTTVSSVGAALRAYQEIGFTPGPALALALLVGVAGAWVSRRSKTWLDLALLVVASAVVLITTSATAGFDYRYVLPAVLLLPPAAVIGGRELWRARRPVPLRRPALLLGVGGLAVALVATNAATGNVVAADRARAPHVQPMGSTAHLAGGLAVTVDSAVVTGTRCARPASGPLPSVERRFDRPTVEWRFAMHVTVSNRGRSQRLVQSWNLATQTGLGWTTLWAYAGGGYLHDAVLGPGHRSVDGNVFEWLPVTKAVVTYTDPTGAGTAAWRLDAPAPPGAVRAGRTCDPRTFLETTS